jgi:hypothetical protein
MVYVCGLLGGGLGFRGASVWKAIRGHIYTILRGQYTNRVVINESTPEF